MNQSIPPLTNSIHYLPPHTLLNRGVSFADFAKRKNYYNQLAFLFEEACIRSPFTEREVGFLITQARRYVKAPLRFLDVACGTGRHTRMLSAKGFSAIGVDSSRALLRIARERDKYSRYIQADMRSFRLGRKFDCVVSLWDAYVYLSRPRDMRSFLSRCSEHLQPGGILILDARNFQRRPIEGCLEKRNFICQGWRVQLLMRRQTNLTMKVHEAFFIYVLNHKRGRRSAVIFDQELVRTHTLRDVRRYMGSAFCIMGTYGDFDQAAEYCPLTSKRMIIVARKRS